MLSDLSRLGVFAITVGFFFYSFVSWCHSFAGVSNWGGYAIACALYILSTCEIHDRYLRKAIGFSQLSKRMVWLSALPSVTKVISVGPRSCDLLMTCRWYQPPATKSCLVQFNGFTFMWSFGDFWKSVVNEQQHCTYNTLQRIQDRLNIKILKN